MKRIMIEPNRKDSKEREILQQIPLIDVTPEENYTHPVNEDNQRTLLIADVVICFTVMTFLVVASWRGTWQLINMYQMYFPLWKTLLVSYLAHGTFALSQNVIHEVLLADYKNNQGLIKTVQFSLRILYLFVFYFTGIAQWASLWSICDTYSQGIALDMLLTMISILFLAIFGGIYNVCSTPMAFSMDSSEETFLFNIRYFSKVGDKTSLYVLDCLFSVLIVGSLVVFVWRGVWLMLDIILFPDNFTISSWGSLILGYICVVFAFLLQPAMRYTCERLNGFSRLLVADTFILFAFFGTVNVWRGIWNLLNIFFLPDNMELSCWITHWVCLIILILCRCSNSLLVRGVYIDAEEPAGKCVVFPCYYLRVIFRKKKLKKLNVASASHNTIVRINHKDEKTVENHVHISTITTTIEENNIEERK
ncbi:transmembrane protein fuseless isoform X1 [Leptinotarsa decemlineata]|uniref:transmembrane protein fuseless isoform X1 n=1 Tax=Leptinotarsa decemlineata TaxID=7539 RepID=UPI003D309269